MGRRKVKLEDIYQVQNPDIPGDAWGEYQDGEREKGVTHSLHYHKYFEGYTEVKKQKPNGKSYIERIYTAPWYKQDLSDKERILIRGCYWLLYALMVYAFVCALIQQIGSNTCVYVAIPGMPTVTLAFLLLVKLIGYTFSKPLMTIYEYKTTGRNVQLLSMACAVGMFMTAVAKGIYLCINGSQMLMDELISLFLCVVAAGSALSVFLLERKIKYTREPNDAVVPEDGVTINGLS